MKSQALWPFVVANIAIIFLAALLSRPISYGNEIGDKEMKAIASGSMCPCLTSPPGKMDSSDHWALAGDWLESERRARRTLIVVIWIATMGFFVFRFVRAYRQE